MQWTDIQKDWKNLSARFKAKWSELTEGDLSTINGKREELVNCLSKHSKTEKVKLQAEVDQFIKTLTPEKV